MADLIWIRAFLINLVNSDNDWDICCLSVVKSFDGLWHNAVICSYNQDRNISDLRTTGTHSCEGFVTRCIDECDCAFGTIMHTVNLVCTDVLSNSAGFRLNNFSLTDCIQETSLTVIDVTHDGNDWRAHDEIFISNIFKLLLEIDIELF